MKHDLTFSDTFIGRGKEMAHLRKAVDSTLANHGRLQIIAGEPGIGKTRLVEELSIYAEEQGILLLRGRCYQERGTPPYWPWIQIVRQYLAGVDADSLATDLGGGASMVATVVPEIRNHLPSIDLFEVDQHHSETA